MRVQGSVRVPLRLRLFASTLALAALASACGGVGGGASSPAEGSKAVTFRSADGVKLEGRLFGEGNGNVGVVLSHMRPADQSSWFDLAAELATKGYVALTFDFRGYCPGGSAGCSEGDKDIAAIWQDVVGAVGYLRSEQAVSAVVLIGASMGGTASLVATARAGLQPAAIITLSAPISIEGLTADAATLALTGPAAKLFIAGDGDEFGAADAAQQMFGLSPQPKRVEILPANEHGTDLLASGQGDVVRHLILTELGVYAPVG